MYPNCEYALPWSAQPPLPLPSTPHYSTAFTVYCYVLYLRRCEVLLAIILSFPSSPKFHTVFPIFPSVAGICVYDHVCFCVYVLDLSFTYERKLGFCLSEPDLLHINTMSSNSIHLPSNHVLGAHLSLS
jgi:hypothetical protein